MSPRRIAAAAALPYSREGLTPVVASMYCEALSMLICREGGNCLTRLVVKLAMCPAMRALEDASVEEGPEATVGKSDGP